MPISSGSNWPGSNDSRFTSKPFQPNALTTYEILNVLTCWVSQISSSTKQTKTNETWIWTRSRHAYSQLSFAGKSYRLPLAKQKINKTEKQTRVTLSAWNGLCSCFCPKGWSIKWSAFNPHQNLELVLRHSCHFFIGRPRPDSLSFHVAANQEIKTSVCLKNLMQPRCLISLFPCLFSDLVPISRLTLHLNIYFLFFPPSFSLYFRANCKRAGILCWKRCRCASPNYDSHSSESMRTRQRYKNQSSVCVF